MTKWMLCEGILFTLLKGFDYEEASILGLILVLLVANQMAFYRKVSLSRQFSVPWLGTIVIGVAVSMWLGTFAFKHVDYSHDLLWEFVYGSDVSRTLRAYVTVTLLILGFIFWQLVRKVPAQAQSQPTNMVTIISFVGRSLQTDANLDLSGDKRFLMSEEEDAFVMY